MTIHETAAEAMAVIRFVPLYPFQMGTVEMFSRNVGGGAAVEFSQIVAVYPSTGRVTEHLLDAASGNIEAITHFPSIAAYIAKASQED